MKSICLFFQIHQPFKYRRYRFFDIGNDHYYYDDYSNETTIRKIAEKSYLPTNKLFKKLAAKHKGQFKIALSISGVTLDLFNLYAPEVLESFKELAHSGCVEFLAETYSHSLSSLNNREIFEHEVKLHRDKICSLFGQKPVTFRNTEMIYSDVIGDWVQKMGFKAILTEGAKQVLGWKSPNFLYVNAINPRMKVLLRNYKLSDDIAFRFSNHNWSEFPLTADKYISWLEKLNSREEVINLFLNYESFGLRQSHESGIYEFLEHWIDKVVKNDNFLFATPSQVVQELQPISIVNVPYPISWADEERDLTSWLGNEMQKEAFDKLYVLSHKMLQCKNIELIKDWNYLQESDHFYYMSTKYFSGHQNQVYENPFDSPYEAFINYMNILSDFTERLDNEGLNVIDDQANIESLQEIIREKDRKIRTLELELKKYRNSEDNKNYKSGNTDAE